MMEKSKVYAPNWMRVLGYITDDKSIFDLTKEIGTIVYTEVLHSVNRLVLLGLIKTEKQGRKRIISLTDDGKFLKGWYLKKVKKGLFDGR